MNLEQYFAQPDAPGKESPVGRLTVRVLEKFPSISFEDARAKAHALLNEAAGRKNYRTPAVYSDVEQAEEAERLKTAFGRVADSPERRVGYPTLAVCSVRGTNKNPATWVEA